MDLTSRQIERLRVASAWARFLSVMSFIATGLFALAFVGMMFARSMGGRGLGSARMAGMLAPLVVGLAVICTVAILLWRYGSNVASFFSLGEPALSRGFRSLRHFFTLWTLFLGLLTALQILMAVARML